MSRANRPSRRVLDHVSRAEIDRVAAFAARVVELLRLPGWKVNISDKTADKADALATVTTTTGRYCATIRLHSTWESLSLDERREVLAHEVLHLAHHRVDDAVNRAAEHMLQSPFDELRDGVTLEIEYMVDVLAYVVADWPAVRQAFDAVYTGVTDPA